MNATALRLLAGLALAFFFAGCGELPSLREMAGLAKDVDPSVDIKAAENRWLLIKNPRFGDVPSEPEYIWVEDDKVPTTMGTLIFGKDSLIAPPEIVPKYGSPPGGGRISPRQKMAVSVEPTPPPPKPGTAAAKGGGQGRRHPAGRRAVAACQSRLRGLRGHEPGRDRSQRQGRRQAGRPGQR